MYSVEKLPKDLDMNVFDGLVIGFPVIHTHPTKRILAFIQSINKLSKPKATYIFTTCGLYSENALRIFAKQCMPKHIIPVLHRVFWGCPASDGALLAPYIKAFFTFPKDIDLKIETDACAFTTIIRNEECKLRMPRFKLYSIINYPNKLAGQLITFPIYTHQNACTKCGKCIANCPAHALEQDVSGYPVLISRKCEKCYRCIHSCPRKALSLSKKKRPKQTLC